MLELRRLCQIIEITHSIQIILIRHTLRKEFDILKGFDVFSKNDIIKFTKSFFYDYKNSIGHQDFRNYENVFPKINTIIKSLKIIVVISIIRIFQKYSNDWICYDHRFFWTTKIDMNTMMTKTCMISMITEKKI